jgi:hypothetical protein
LTRKPKAASESSTYAALLASQNKNIVAMMKTAIAFKYGSITDNLARNSGCGELVFIFTDFPHLRGQAEPTEDQGQNIDKDAYFT